MLIDAMKRYRRLIGVRGMVYAIKGEITRKPTSLKVRRPEIKFPFYIRVPSSDVSVFEQIFVAGHYDFDIQTAPATIVDAGANIGLASLYLANRFPNSQIVAIEPEASNFELLERNVAPYDNITPIRGALWHEDTKVLLVDPNRGKWGFTTLASENIEELRGQVLYEVQGMTVGAIMKQQGIQHIDILKIDIEGAECEVFRDPSAWVDHVDSVIVELHERLRSGCNRSFYNSTNGFDDEWLQGDSVYLTRRRGCRPTPPTHATRSD